MEEKNTTIPIERQITLEEKRQYKMNPHVFKAASSGDSTFFENLADSDPNSNALLQVTIEKNTVLHVALQFEKFEAAKKIVNLSPSLVYETNSKGNTPLHVAVRIADFSMVKFLINQAKDQRDVETGGQQQLLSMVNEDGDTALHVAVRYGKFEVVKELINENDPAELAKQVNNTGESALFIAVDIEHYEMASHILSNAPNCSYVGRHGMNVLHALVLHTSCYVNKEILLPLREIESSGQASRLDRAFITCSWVINMLFLHKFRDPRSTTFVYRKLQRTYGAIPEDFVKEVMRKWPFTIEQGDSAGWTPLHIAAHMGNEKYVKLLLENGNSPGYVKNDEGLSALHIAAKKDNVNVMKELVTACPDIYEFLDPNGQTALHVAAKSGKSKAVEFFLNRPEFKNLINEQDKEGNTPMHLATIEGQDFIASQLRSSRYVDLIATNKKGFTTMDNFWSRITLFGSSSSLLTNFNKKNLWKLGARSSLKGELLRMGIQNLDRESKPDQQAASDGRDRGHGDSNGTSVLDYSKRMSETNLLVAALIATVTFTAAFTVPGGYNQNENKGEGLALLSKRKAFRTFLMANTLAFGLSTTSVFVHFFASATIMQIEFYSKVVKHALRFTNWSIGAMLVAFIAGTYTAVPHSLGISAAVLLSCCFLSSLFLPFSIIKEY